MSLDYKKKKVEKLIFFLLFFAGSYFFHPHIEYANTSSRYFMISAAVDFGSFNIDVYKDYTVDKSYWNGHYYSNKAIGAPLLGVPVYWVMRNLPSLRDGPPLGSIERHFIRIVTTTLPFAFLGSVMFRISSLWGANFKIAIWMVLSYAFGSIAFVHATIFSGHQVAACFAFFSFFILFRLNQLINEKKEGQSLQHIIQSFLSGLFMGLAALADYTAMFIALLITVYLLFLRLPLSLKFSFLLGGILCVVTLAAYNAYCFGSPWSMSYVHLVDEEYQEGSAGGLFGVSLPDPMVFLSILMSPSRGLFFIMPIFIFSLTGFVALWKRYEFRRETLLILAIVVGYLFINAGFYGWHGGWTFGPRYLVPALPFLALPMAFTDWKSFWFYLLFGISLFQIFLSAIGLSHAPQEIQNPIVEFFIPFLGYGYLKPNLGLWIGLKGLISFIPLLIIAALIVYIMIRIVDTPSQDTGTSLYLKTTIGLWSAIILIMLFVVRTRQPELVHYYRSVSLDHAARATNSAKFKLMSTHEAQLAEKIKTRSKK